MAFAFARSSLLATLFTSRSFTIHRSGSLKSICREKLGGGGVAMDQVGGVSIRPKNVVLYHYPCPDGIFAALAAHLYHSAIGRPVSFLPNTVFEPLRVEDISTKNVETFYLLDFAGPQGFAVELAKKAKEVVVLDHHKTALETLPPNGTGPPNLQVLLDMKRSGATIAYDYFLEKLQVESSLQTFLQDDDASHLETLFKYIQDADLWTWALPESKQFSSGLSDCKIEYNAVKNGEVFHQLLALDPEVLIKRGKVSLQEKQKLIDLTLDRSFVVSLGQGKFGQCLAVRADAVANLRSELGNQLAAKSRDQGLRAIGAVVYVEEAMNDASMFKISLRSLGSTEDTTEISQVYGGGGHRNASSFLLSVQSFERWKA
ncbi:uncharacterized protein [Physcomitrium patens]|nr:uncharacterized protein LOC112281045 isoform X2 [Physcomitrium patens]PNR54914.1 hypothetical protein PHYPA_005807 [Physcomitrium patens]|eukprot:XP_024372960.1 uncharacterized protein LOC112281045 isoform X2 [Physcomitrella patens]